jgi:hypothetical protein
MRTANFRDDVLWALAYKAGLEPRDDLSTDQATAYVSFINSRLRRAYEIIDTPEWTITEERTPDASHWVALEQTSKTPIAHVFKVYLLDPDTTRGPIETPFRLGDQGVHVGFEHGTTVFIKFNTRAPKFTSTLWLAETTYALGDLVYGSATGNVYSSAQGSNTGHAVTDPTWWTPVDFPFVLVDLVVQGAYADALRDDGQHDKAAAEEQIANSMFQEFMMHFSAAPIEPLTSQKPTLAK